jgi:hypothetical protein
VVQQKRSKKSVRRTAREEAANQKIRRWQSRLAQARKLIDREGDPAEDAQNEWDDLRRELHGNLKRRAGVERLSPYDAPKAYFKREVYRFVHRLLTAKCSEVLKAILIISCEELVSRDPKTFKSNPFAWAMSCFRNSTFTLHEEYEGKPKKRESVIHVDRDMIWEYSRQLEYAWRHRVCPDLLIGFIYQCGGEAEVVRKAKDRAAVEDWLHQ